MKLDRKRTRRPRVDQAPERAYLNPLTLPLMLSSAVLFLPVAFAPVLFPAVKELPSWAVIPVMACYFGLFSTLSMRTAFHVHWSVGRDWLRSVYMVPGASFSRSFENHDFISLTTRGPFVIVRRASGERHVWPRWLRSQWKTYRWALVDGRLELRGPGAGPSHPK